MTTGAAGRLFGPELPGAGVAARAHWEHDGLRVVYDSGELLAAPIRCEASGFNGEQLRISFGLPGASYAFVVGDDDARRRLQSGAPPEALLALRVATRAQARVRQRFIVIGLFVGSLAVVLPIAVYWSLSLVSSYVAEHVPVEQEEQLGKLVLAQTRATRELIEQGTAVDALHEIGKKLTFSSRYRYRWFVVKAPELNAFAAPGGFVVVTTGLLEAASSGEEVAGVLAHEVAHAELRHGATALIKSMGLRGTFHLLLGGWGPDAPALFAHFTELRFSRDAEREADQEGLRRLRVAQIDPAAMLSMFSKLAQQRSASGPELPTFLSTHPDIGERIESLRSELQRAPAKTVVPLALDYAAVRASLPK